MTEQELASATEPPAEAAKVYEPEEAGDAVASANEAQENGPESPSAQRCKLCEKDALPLSLFCKGHQENFVQNGAKKAGLRRLDVLLVAVLIGLLWLYPTVQRPEWVTNHDAGVWGSFSALFSRLTGRKSAPRADAGGKTAEGPSVRRSKKSLAAGSAACGNGVLDSGELCDGKALGGATCASLGFAGDCGSDSGCLHPSLACLGNCRFDYSGCTAESQAAIQRFVDNGDATATDRLTGLVWELKCVAGDCQAQHDVVTKLPWQDAAKQWVGSLNSERFAGHDDWRLPSLEELRTLLTAVPPCATPPCPAAAWPRGGTAAAGYWSSTSFSLDRKRAWAISFGDGEAYTAAKDATLYVRAVRDGS